MLQKQKLTIKEQIEHMERKGIKFNIVPKDKAEEYISKSTYILG